MAELAMKSYVPPGTSVMSEDQIHEWADSIKRAEVECDAARGSEQRVAQLENTLAARDREITHL